MDDSTLFDKTAAGEEAVRERTRLVQRNLRLMLIMVDGQKTVAELKKGGDALLAESALTQLEALGLIAPRRNGAAAVTPLEVPAAAAPAPEMPSLPPLDADSDPVPVVVMPPTPVPPRPRQPSLLSRLAENWRKREERREVIREQEAVERTFAEEDAAEDAMAEALRAPAHTPPRPVMPLLAKRSARRARPLRLVGLGLLALIGTLALGLLLYPYGMYRVDMERRLSAVLGDTVAIGEVGVSFSPLPYITLHRVSVGATPYATAQTVRVLPELTSLFDEHKVLRQVRVSGLELLDQAVVPLGGWFPADSAGRLTIRQMSLDAVSWKLGVLSSQNWSGDVQFGSRGELAAVRLQSDDGKDRAELRPAPKGLHVHLAFNDWRPAFAEPLRFTSLSADGFADAGGIRLTSLDAAVSDGRLAGAAALLWGDDLALTADLTFRHLGLDSLLEALGSAGLIAGPANGGLKLVGRGPSVDRLLAQLSATGSFDAAAGTLRHLGLVESLQGMNRAGSTRFEKMAGDFVVAPDGTRLEHLKLSSGALRAGGRIELSAKGELGGRLDVELRSSGSVQRASLTVGGTAAEPTLGAPRR